MSSSKGRLLEALNEDFTPQNTFTETNLRFDAVTAEGIEGYNSKLTLSGLPGRGYYGSVDLFFNRLDLSVLEETPGIKIELRREGDWSVADVVTGLNGLRRAQLTEDDIEFSIAPPAGFAPGSEAEVQITAKNTSWQWQGDLDLKLVYGKPYLNQVVFESMLNTINHPHGKRDLPAAWVMLYYTDFTSYRDALKINPSTGIYTDPDKVKDIMARLGMPNWGVTGAIDYPTSAVPESNQSFDRVIVQTVLGSAYMYGPVYFHYNNFDEAPL